MLLTGRRAYYCLGTHAKSPNKTCRLASRMPYNEQMCHLALPAVEQDGKQQSFHVVAPSMPGFAFSGKPKRPGFGPRQMGEAVNTLMLKLGYSRYVAQGAAHH